MTILNDAIRICFSCPNAANANQQGVFFLRPFSSERTYYCLTCRVNTTLKEPRGRMRRKCGVSSDCVFDVDSHLHRIWQGQTGQAVSNSHVEF